MTVEDLIKELQKLPPKATVWVVNGKGNSWVAPTQVEVRSKKLFGDNRPDVGIHDVYLSDGT